LLRNGSQAEDLPEVGRRHAFDPYVIEYLLLRTPLSSYRMKHHTVYLIFVILISIHCSCQQNHPDWADINYADDGLVSHQMDIYLPDKGGDAYPVVVIIYGSGFGANDLKRTAFKTLGKPLLKSGFAVASVNHRSSRDAIYPAQIHDIKAAVRFIRGRGAEYKIDTSFIGITGYSSGGYLSALAGTSGSVRQMALDSESVFLEGDVGSYSGYRSSVDAVVDWFGPIDFPTMDSCGSSMIHDAPDSPESILIGGPVQEHKLRCALANPITYIDADDPPFFILHGENDSLVPYCQSAMFHEALHSAGVSSQFILVPRAKHGPGLFEKSYFRMMCDFFLRELKGKQ